MHNITVRSVFFIYTYMKSNKLVRYTKTLLLKGADKKLKMILERKRADITSRE